MSLPIRHRKKPPMPETRAAFFILDERRGKKSFYAEETACGSLDQNSEGGGVLPMDSEKNPGHVLRLNAVSG